MKKFIGILLVIVMLFSVAVPVFAAKPENLPEQANEKAKANYQEMLTKLYERDLNKEYGKDVDIYNFYLSGDVMPTPPDGNYGLSDIEGSDIYSRLLVKQLNEDNVANVTGVIKGFDPETEYTVYISNGYEVDTSYPGLLTSNIPAFTFETDEDGNGIFEVTLTNDDVTYEDGIELFSVWINAPGATILISETVTLVDMDIYDFYLSGDVMPSPPYGTADIEDSDVKSKLIVTPLDEDYLVNVAGVMKELNPETEYTVYISNGYEVDTAFPGLLTSNIPAFTFITDEDGNGEWDVNIEDEDVTFEDGIELFSVWINDGVTILISDVVTLTE